MKKYVKPDTSKTRADFTLARPVVFAGLKPTSEPISLRIPVSVLERLKREAHRRGLPYQSYIKNVLAEAVGP
jgi:predicted DNA binding CopG/RHH family protein